MDKDQIIYILGLLSFLFIVINVFLIHSLCNMPEPEYLEMRDDEQV